MNYYSLLIVFIGGGLGAASRYMMTSFIGNHWDTVFPYGTLTVNTLGSFIIGFITFYFAFQHNSAVPEQIRLLLVVGFLGGFTTFSSFALETLTIAQDHIWVACTNILGNICAVMIAVFLGLILAKSVV